jgi:hypothetical protein
MKSETYPVSETLSSSYLEFQTTDKVRKPIDSVFTYVFVFSSTEKALPPCEPLPLTDTALTLPFQHQTAQVLPNTSHCKKKKKVG